MVRSPEAAEARPDLESALARPSPSDRFSRELARKTEPRTVDRTSGPLAASASRFIGP